MLKNLKTRWEAIGLVLCLAFTTGLAPGAPKPATGNVVYVDNVTGDDANPGTAAQPKATIQAGENAAEELYGENGVVVVRGGGTAYEGAEVTSSIKFYGNGADFNGQGNHGNAPPPMVNGAFYANDIGSLTIKGFEFAGPSADVISMANVGEVILADNSFHDIPYYGIAIFTSGSATSSIHLDNNHFARVGGFCCFISSSDTSRLTLTASNNSIVESPSAYGFTLRSDGNSEMTAVLDKNVVDGADSGLWTTSSQDSLLRVKYKNNKVLAPSSVGVRFESAGSAYHAAELTGNLVEAGISGGIDAFSSEDSTLDVFAGDNTVKENLPYGMTGASFTAFGTSELNAVYENNRVHGSLGGAATDDAAVNVTISENEITGVEGYTGAGISVYGNFNGVINAMVFKNRVTDVGGHGIELLSAYGPSPVITALYGNVISGVGGDGIHVDFENPANSVTGTQNNAVTGSAGNSLEVVNESVPGQIKLNGEIISPLVDTP